MIWMRHSFWRAQRPVSLHEKVKYVIATISEALATRNNNQLLKFTSKSEDSIFRLGRRPSGYCKTPKTLVIKHSPRRSSKTANCKTLHHHRVAQAKSDRVCASLCVPVLQGYPACQGSDRLTGQAATDWSPVLLLLLLLRAQSLSRGARIGVPARPADRRLLVEQLGGRGMGRRRPPVGAAARKGSAVVAPRSRR